MGSFGISQECIGSGQDEFAIRQSRPDNGEDKRVGQYHAPVEDVRRPAVQLPAGPRGLPVGLFKARRYGTDIADAMAGAPGRRRHHDNHGMGTIFEELVRRFDEENNEEAGKHWTPRDAVRLTANLVFLPVAGEIESSTYLLYDGACGTGGMLTVAEETLQGIAREHGKEVATHLYAQEINAETYAICKADLLLKGKGDAADNIVGGPEHSTLSNDAFASRAARCCLCAGRLVRAGQRQDRLRDQLHSALPRAAADAEPGRDPRRRPDAGTGDRGAARGDHSEAERRGQNALFHFSVRNCNSVVGYFRISYNGRAVAGIMRRGGSGRHETASADGERIRAFVPAPLPSAPLVAVHPANLPAQPFVATYPRRPVLRAHLTPLVLGVRRWGDRHLRTNRPDPVSTPMNVDERHPPLARRSRSAWAKYAEALRTISFARRRSRTSRSSSFSR